jgi:hypothetical protein
MAEFERLHAGNSEVQEKQAVAFDYAQTATAGLVVTGVLTGLVVTQTTTASGSVVIAAGAGVIGSSVGAGVSEPVNPGAVTLDVFTANPVGGLPRNDIIVWDSATRLLAVVVGTPNATPTDPTVANTKLALARLRHAASATTIPLAKIDDIRIFTGLRGTPIPVHTAAERNALAAYDGLTVYRLDTHIAETYNGTAWVAQSGADVSTSVTVYSSGTSGFTTVVKAWRNGPVVTCQVNITGTPSFAANASRTIALFPVGLRPALESSVTLQSETYWFNAWIQDTGEIRIWNGSGSATFPGGICVFTLSWIIA